MNDEVNKNGELPPIVNTKYTIDRDVPMPTGLPTGRAMPRKYPWPDMEVGHSVLFPRVEGDKASKSAALYGKQAKPPRKFAVRTLPEGVRIWRIQ